MTEHQHLKYAAKPLTNGTLSDYDIQRDSTIHMLKRVPGGRME
jgi:hypothetical protein